MLYPPVNKSYLNNIVNALSFHDSIKIIKCQTVVMYWQYIYIYIYSARYAIVYVSTTISSKLMHVAVP